MVTAQESTRSIFPKANSFSLEEFSSTDFIVKDFIEGLTDSSIPASRRPGLGNNAFDPKPYIRTFEAALDRLKELDETLSEKESELKEGVRRAEIEHTRTLDRLGEKFNTTLAEFHRLDSSITDGGGVAVRIGGQLEQLDKQRQRAEDARFLIQCFTEFNRGDTGRLERLRRTGRIEDSIRCAVVSRQLSLIVKRNESATGQSARTKIMIEAFSESLEQDLLRQFDDAYRRFKIEAMKGCAKVLHDFNGGASVVSNFLNQMDFFIATGKINAGEVTIEQTIEEKLSDPDESPPGLEPSLLSLISEIRDVLKVESKTIKEVFPNPEQVLGTFLQRVFQQSLQQRLEMVLDKTATLSPLAFLRTLQASRTSVIALADDLKAHGLTEHPGPLSASTTMVVDQNVEELFVPYLQDRGYMEKEKDNLEQLYSGLLLKFSIFHDQRKKNQNLGVFDRLKKSRERAIEKVLESDLAKSQNGALSRIIGLDRRSGGDAHLSDVVVSEVDGQLNVDFSKRMLKWLAEAVGRSIELSSAADTPKDVFALLNILVEHMRTMYLDVALDAAMDIAEQQTKAEPDLTYVLEIKPATKIMHLMFSFINTALIPLSQTSLTTRREMVKFSNTTLTSLEQKVNNIIQKTIDAVIAYIGSLLAKQKKQDYRPKDDEVSLTTLQTPTCLNVCAFLAKVHAVAIEALDGANLDGFLSEIGAGLRGLLLEHLKKFQVNQAGAIMLSKDITKYRDLVDKWGVACLKDGFELLHEIGNLFVVGPAALKGRMRDGVLARVKPGILRPYLVKRDDYTTVGIEKILMSD